MGCPPADRRSDLSSPRGRIRACAETTRAHAPESPMIRGPQLVQMSSPFAAIDTIFNHPRDATVILFLIEDSVLMVPLWQHLRSSYLPSILTAASNTNPSTLVSPLTPLPSPLSIITFQTKALWMIASEQSPFNPSARQTPCRGGVPVINFNTHLGSTISPVSVTRAIQVRQARFRHLFTRHTTSP